MVSEALVCALCLIRPSARAWRCRASARRWATLTPYRRAKVPANLVQAQRDFFGSHTYERIDKEGWFHTVWDPRNSADSITTSSYNN